jgi:hypothetical protein
MTSGSAGEEHLVKFKFNTDLLLNDVDRQTASDRFPDVYFALDHEELRSEFIPLDRDANAAKKRSRHLGVAAVALGGAALITAAAEPLYEGLSATTVHIVAGCAAAAGMLSVIIGLFGLMFRARKAHWLQLRLATERLRQFHFQSIVTQAADILLGSEDEKAREAFVRNRQVRFAGFKRDFLDLVDAEMPNGDEEAGKSSGWIWRESVAVINPQHPKLPQLMEAYETLRFKRQLQYVNFKLIGYGRLWKDAPGKQVAAFSAIALVCVLLIMLIHGLVISGVAFGISWMTSPLVHVAAIWTAIVVLAVRTLEEGLQPGREVERLRQYQSTIKLAYQRFREATTIAEKTAAMKQMEEASYQEMVIFLKASSDAKFVM